MQKIICFLFLLCTYDYTRSESKEPSPGNTVPKQKDDLPKDCGRRRIFQARIVGGEESPPGFWPWLGALYVFEFRISKFKCGSSLISERYVVTAGHCVTKRNGAVFQAGHLSVRLGSNDLTKGEAQIEIGVDKVSRHERYVNNYTNDISLLRLEQRVRFNDYVQPICLPLDVTMREADFASRHAVTAGWGKTQFQGNISEQIRHVALPVWSKEKCKAAMGKLVMSEQHLCAGYPDGGKDACQMDSGGPLMIGGGPEHRIHLVGVVSFGKKCAEPNSPGVYTKVQYYLKWIQDNMT